MSNIIKKDWNGKTFTFREDGYFNMTKAAKEFGKQLINFWSNLSTRQYVVELAGTISNHWDSNDFSNRSEEIDAARRILTDSTRGRATGGTWAHPKLAVFFARWLDVRFAVACDAMIEDILTGAAKLHVVEPDRSATLALPDTHIKAVEQLLDQLKQNQNLMEMNRQLQAENDQMRPLVSFVTVATYVSRDNHYPSRGERSVLGRRATKLARERGIELDQQHKTFVDGEGVTRNTAVNIYPIELLDEVFEQMNVQVAA